MRPFFAKWAIVRGHSFGIRPLFMAILGNRPLFVAILGTVAGMAGAHPHLMPPQKLHRGASALLQEAPRRSPMPGINLLVRAVLASRPHGTVVVSTRRGADRCPCPLLLAPRRPPWRLARRSWRVVALRGAPWWWRVLWLRRCVGWWRSAASSRPPERRTTTLPGMLLGYGLRSASVATGDRFELDGPLADERAFNLLAPFGCCRRRKGYPLPFETFPWRKADPVGGPAYCSVRPLLSIPCKQHRTYNDGIAARWR